MEQQGIICQNCGIEAPVRFVEFYQNIGALVMRFHSKYRGNVCRNCLHSRFWSMTGITIAVGWLGVISFFIAPIFVINNLIRYLTNLGMPAVPPGATPPQATAEAMAKFLPLADQVFSRVQAGEGIHDVARAIAPSSGLSPGQVLVCAVALAQIRQASVQSTGGFPVIPPDEVRRDSMPGADASPAPARLVSAPPPLPPQKPEPPTIGLGA